MDHTFEGQRAALNALRKDRAVAYFRKGNLAPLQLEALRFVQERTDKAFELGQKLQREGKLRVRLSEREALGTFIDGEVRKDLRAWYTVAGIDAAGAGPVRVNRRENGSGLGERGYRRPDARIGRIAYDVTLAKKTAGFDQIRGFFATDFRPTHAVIVRPSQLGGVYTYAITGPGE